MTGEQTFYGPGVDLGEPDERICITDSPVVEHVCSERGARELETRWRLIEDLTEPAPEIGRGWRRAACGGSYYYSARWL